MKIQRVIHSLLIGTMLSIGVANAAFDDLFKSAGELLDKAPAGVGSTATSSLSDSQIGAGLKEALSIGAERAVELLGRPGGFLDDRSVRIPLPGMLDTAAKGLRTAGQGHYVDQFETTVNRAAEQAIPQTLEIVKETVSGMSLEDVRGILSGGDDAATRFLRERAGGSLADAIRPIVAQATDSAGATAAYKSLKSQADGMLGGLGMPDGWEGGGRLLLQAPRVSSPPIRPARMISATIDSSSVNPRGPAITRSPSRPRWARAW